METIGDKCGLLDLPGEIRNSIWREVFRRSYIGLLGGNNDALATVEVDSFHPEILRTCKTINYEARPVLASSTSIILENCGSSQIKSPAMAYYSALAPTLSFTEHIKEPPILECFKALRFLDICEACVSPAAYLAESCHGKRADRYMAGDYDSVLVRKGVQILVTHVRNTWMRKLFDKHSRNFQVGFRVTCDLYAEADDDDADDEPEGLCLSFDLDTQCVLRRFHHQPKSSQATTWENGKVTICKYDPGRCYEPGKPREIVSQAPWLASQGPEDRDTYVADDFEDWYINGQFEEEQGHVDQGQASMQVD